MPREWYATCKDCGNEYGYSDDSYQLSARRGLSRPERCPECRNLHAREIATLGLSHFELTPLLPIPPTGLQAGRLGGLVRPPRIHEARDREPTFDLNKFGIKDSNINEYFELMLKKQVTVVVAPTGAGKSTFLPYRLMVPPSPFPKDLFTRNGQIVITQPRIQATRNIPLFVARDLHGSNLGAGFDVGFRHSGSPSTDWRNKMVYMTDGTLINMIVRNELDRLSVIMIDEAHERSLNIDLILGLFRTQLPRYPKLKLIIASATINAGMFLEYYGGPKGFDPDRYAGDTGEGFLAYDNQQIANALKDSSVGFYGFPGKRQYPVGTRFREEDSIPEEQWSGRMPDEMAKKVLQILRDIQSGKEQARGDILGFLHGEAPIERTVELIRSGVEDDTKLAGQVDVLPLYTKLPQKQQDAALLPKKKKDRLRVVISTNVAETSLTVDGIVHVVDSGLINESQWDSKTQTSFVVPKIHSQAGCKQRWGRGGRIQPGVAHCLYTKEQFDRFPKHTDPEILRAPLDQIVLTAKAAGIDDIRNFEWIQRPSQEELDRAPRLLQQIGAIDAEGDLTEHGLELRGFGEEVDIANLMILADRFGCAVEMATILPMRNLGGYTKLLLWDKGWDANTKRSVHKIHQGLLDPCMDDLEFCLKMWQAWEGIAFGRGSMLERDKWSNRYFVNHHIFKDQIAQERESLLTSLSGHKKEQVFRPINFDLLTRLRILMTCGLPNQIYLLDEKQKPESELAQAPVYKPYIPQPGSNPELELLHSEAVVEISLESICSDRAMHAFVCGQRQRIRRRMSPLSEPLTIIAASFLTLIKPEWLQYINQPMMNLARSIAAETRNELGELIESTTQARLFIDQSYPVGATFRCQNGTTRDSVQIGQLILTALQIQPRRSNEEIDVPVDLEYLEAEKTIQTTGVSEEDQKFIVDVEDDTETDSQLTGLTEDISDQDNDLPVKPLSQQKAQTVFSGRITHSPKSKAIGAEFDAFVTGYDFSVSSSPVILFEIPDDPTPFDKFNSNYKTGDTIFAVVSSIEQYVNDRLTYLVVREEKSGLEIIMDPYNASLSGRNFAVEILQPGDLIEATIEDVDAKARIVRVSRLKQAEAEILRFIGRGDERVLDVIIVEVRDNGLYVWLNPEAPRSSIPISSFIYIDRLPQRPEEMWLGRFCKVKMRTSKFKREIRRGFGNLSEDDSKRLRKFAWDDKFHINDEDSGIITSRRITYSEKLRLLKLSSNSEFQKAVNTLYRRSNEFDVRIIDLTGIESLVPFQGQRVKNKWHINKILDDALVVSSPDGFESIIPKKEAVYDINIDLRSAFIEGMQVDVTIRQVNIEESRVDLTLLKPEDDPFRQYHIGQIVQGKVRGFKKDGSGAFVELSPGVIAYVYKDEISFDQIDDARKELSDGQLVTARITEIDLNKRWMRLTIRGLVETSLQLPLTHIRIIKGRNGNTIIQLQNDTRTKINIDNDGLCIIQGLNSQDVALAGQRIEKLLETCFITFSLEHQQINHLIGKNGSTIKGIEQNTSAQIHIDQNSKLVTITAPNRISLNKTLQEVQNVVSFVELVVTVQADMIGRRIIGTGGKIKDEIQQSASVVIWASKDDSGEVIIEGKTVPSVQLAEQIIRNKTGWAVRKTLKEYRMPVYQEVKHESAVLFRVTRSPSQETPGPLEQLTQANPSPQEAAVSSLAPQFKVTRPPQNYQSFIQYPLQSLPKLFRRQSGFFTSIFAKGKTTLELIVEETRTQIRVNSTTGVLTITGSSQEAVSQAIKRLKNLL